MLRKRYTGAFVNVKGQTFRCEIWQQSDTPWHTATELQFDGDQPLTIEWEETDKEQPICSSSATLTIISCSDRQYTDLFTIQPGAIALRVYLDDQLYWVGTLDPEFYEEPFQTLTGYNVTLTFTDFGILSRLNFAYEAYTITPAQMVDLIISQAALSPLTPDYTLISTHLTTSETTPITQALTVLTSNFFDEDNQPSTLEDTLTGILQPLALRIIQRHGHLWIYDLNALATAPTAPIQWDSDEQTLTTDKVLNNVRIKFSAYAQEDILKGNIEFSDKEEPTWNYINNALGSNVSPDNWVKDLYSEFRIAFTPKAKTTCFKRIFPDAQYFRTQSYYGSSSEDTGLCFQAIINNNADRRHINDLGATAGLEGCTPTAPQQRHQGIGRNLWPSNVAKCPYSCHDEQHGDIMYQTNPFWLSQAPFLLEQPALLSYQYTPFTSYENPANEGENYKFAKDNLSIIYIPMSLTLQGADGNRYAYTTSFQSDGTTGTYNPKAPLTKKWIQIPADEDPFTADHLFWLAYYQDSGKLDDIETTTPISEGWTTNRDHSRLARNLIRLYVNDAQGYAYTPTLNSTGEVIPTPPTAGQATLTMYVGADGQHPGTIRITSDSYLHTPWAVAIHPSKAHLYQTAAITPADYASIGIHNGSPLFNAASTYSMFLYNRTRLNNGLRWIMFKQPQLKYIVDAEFGEAINTDDIEYTGWINPDAKDGIDIDTTCGTLLYRSTPSARGLYRDAHTLDPITHLTRAGHTDCPERLLIGTLYSQYATRHLILKGITTINPWTTTPLVYTDPHYDTTYHGSDGSTDRVYTPLMIKAETIDAMQGTADTIFCEVTPDTYTAIDEYTGKS